MFPSYIGICDFYDESEVKHSLSVFKDLCKIHKVTDRKLMIGTMMSYKTLNGLRSKWTSIWLKNEEVSSVFIDHPLALNTLHYADYHKGDTQWSDLERAINFGGQNLHAIQLDMVWPLPGLVIEIKKKYPEIGVVLQVSKEALEQIDHDKERLLKHLRRYDNSVDCVLLDKSGGNGIPLKTEELLPFARTISVNLPYIKMAVAGGLGPYSVKILGPILEEFPDLSWDAQSKLRPSGDARDRLDLRMCDVYTIRSMKLLDKREK